MSPKVSVVIPVYNGELFIKKAIHSVLAQESQAHEILVIDDGSTDNTPSILEGFKSRVIVKRIANQGSAVARNVGIRLSTGDYLAFLDADDVWFRHRLKTAIAYILKYPEVGFFCSNYIVRYPDLGRKLVKHYSVVPERNRLNFDEPLKVSPLKLLLRVNFVGTPSAVIVKKRLVEQAGLFKPDYAIVEDLGFFIEMSMLTNFVLIKDVLSYKRLHEMNISGQTIPMVINHKKLLMDVSVSKKQYLNSHQLSNDGARALARLNYWLGTLYFDAGDKKKAFSLYWEGLRSASGVTNFLEFLWALFKKSVRLLTGDFLSFKNLRKSYFKRKKF